MIMIAGVVVGSITLIVPAVVIGIRIHNRRRQGAAHPVDSEVPVGSSSSSLLGVRVAPLSSYGRVTHLT